VAVTVAVLFKTINSLNYILPRLVHYDFDLSRRWYIVFYVKQEKTNKLVRKRYSAINHADDVNGRVAAARSAIKQITNLLTKGALADCPENLKTEEEKPEIDPKKIGFSPAVLYVMDKKAATVRKNSLRYYVTLSNAILEFEKYKGRIIIKFSEVDTVLLHSFFDWLIEKKKIGNKTFNNYHITLTAVYNYLQKRFPKTYTKNFCENVTRLKVSKGDSHKPYTPEQIELIKEEIIKRNDHQLLLFIQFIYFGFLRPHTEALFLKIENIHEKTILIPASISKNRNAEFITIPPGLERAIGESKLRSYPKEFYIFGKNGEPGLENIKSGNIYNRHSCVLRALKLDKKGYDIYGYKHTGNITLFHNGANLKHIQQQNRHESVTMTDKYLRGFGLLTNQDISDKFGNF